ncbi:MAG: tRNA pseudouridine(13) synthase TruD [Planctomycetes bacterium]|nr:tRNA pseudouridine(13) synthase TruD [Planctomycetota bacterium]
MQKPIRPVLPEPPAPRVHGRYKVEVEDFAVEELPAYAPSGSGTHSFVWIEKRGLSTLDAIARLAGAVGANQREFGYAGLKDAQAVTRQWLSVEHVDPERLRGVQLEGVTVLEVSRHGNKLKPGHLRGNRFSILLRGAAPEDVPALSDNLAWCARRGILNYFGEQRFGKRGANLDQGLRILQSAKPKREAYRFAPRILKLLLSAVQSEVFNRVLAARLETFDRILDGDLAFVHGSGATFTVHDLPVEQARCDAFEISPTGPLPGPKMLLAKAEVGALEEAVLQELEVSAEAFGFHRSMSGGRRPLRLPVSAADVAGEAEGIRVRFELPAGAYATSVLRQLLVDSPWFGTA